ncbi:MAG TPA: DUF2568 domain-containing protein [Mycobacterium sp.]|jgi:hypothetical protein|nr:DUF2568 domain-containing protein [Mycobacterium sp.]
MPPVRARSPTAGPPKLLASTNLALKFALELAALALLAYWGAVTGTGVWALVLAVAAPALMIGLWASFAAPRAAHRLSTRARIPLELGLFGLACGAGYAAGAPAAATAFAVVATLNALALTWLRQWTN